MTDDSTLDGDLAPVTLTGGQKIYVHKRRVCAGAVCCIHNPSDHHMITWPQVWRDDTGVMERHCPHGIGHPDPDHMSYVLTKPGPVGERSSGVHGCDNCCHPEPTERSWEPGDPVYADETAHSTCESCGTTWTPAADMPCPECETPPGTATETHPYTPTWSIHPGETLREWIEYTATTAAAVAAGTTLPLDRVEAIVAGQAPITLDVALRLAEHTGISVHLWINLQANYDRIPADHDHCR